MASNSVVDEWIKLKKVVFEWIEKHPNQSMDLLFAKWIDPSEYLLRQYKECHFLKNIQQYPPIL